MPDWQERITRDTAPAIRVEHDVRYALAAPLIVDSAAWLELGCGSGVSAAAALGGRFSGRAILVDVEDSAVQQAASELALDDTISVQADLATEEGVERAREALRAAPPGPRTVTCFETVEHLERFVPLIDALVELAATGDATVLLSVPNDAHWAIENPYHQTAWGEGAFEELRALLPAGHVVLHQVPLSGSALVAGEDRQFAPAVTVPDGRVPSHFLAAFGPRAGRVGGTAAAEAMDLQEERRWQRQRDAYLAMLEADLALLEADAAELREVARDPLRRVEEFRTYIHELEDRLGIPRSGTPERAAYDAQQAGT